MNPGYAAHIQRVQARRERLRAELAALFAERPPACTLEIGCGHGHFLAAYAAAHPEEFCLGIDILGERLQKTLRKTARAGLDNVALLKAEATELLVLLPEEVRFGRVFALFPDPWPKKRHWKNRLVQPAFLDALAVRCPSGTPFCFRTDHDPYTDWAREVLAAHPLWAIDPQAPWPFEEETIFQQRAPAHRSTIARRRPG